MRRAFILGLAVTVIAAGLMPLSACALLTSKMAECADSSVQSPCDQMHPQPSAPQSFKNSSKSCCVAAQAPLPELQFKAVVAGPSLTTSVTPQILAVPGAALYSPLLLLADTSPPATQSLLCTFLI